METKLKPGNKEFLNKLTGAGFVTVNKNLTNKNNVIQTNKKSRRS